MDSVILELETRFGPHGGLEPVLIARGLPLWEVDVGPDTLPPEAGFEYDAISSTKGCYIGQEVISRLRSVGHVNRHLCILTSRLPPSTCPNISTPASCSSEDGKPLAPSPASPRWTPSSLPWP